MTPVAIKMESIEIGTRLREAREAQGLSTENLAKSSGTNPAALEKLENGEIMSPLTIVDLAGILGVTPAWLMWGEK